jgi:hypothetical protein
VVSLGISSVEALGSSAIQCMEEFTCEDLFWIDLAQEWISLWPFVFFFAELNVQFCEEM